MGLREDLGRGPVGLDTVAFIYFIEEHPDYLPLLDPIFEAVDGGKLQVVTSSLTLLEVLVVPYRFGNLPLAQKYEWLLTRSRGLTLVDLDLPLLRGAAKIRALSAEGHDLAARASHGRPGSRTLPRAHRARAS